MCVCQVVNEMYGDNMSIELDELPLPSGQYHMAEFAKKYFREAQRNRRSETQRTAKCIPLRQNVATNSPQLTLVVCLLCFTHSDLKAKKGKEGRDPSDMVKFSKVNPGSQSDWSMSFVL